MISECDSCGEMEIVNEYQLCKRCNYASEVFIKTAGKVRVLGGTTTEAYKVGMAAQEKAYKEYVCS